MAFYIAAHIFLILKYFSSYGAISLSLLKLQYSYLPILKTLFLKISNKIDAFMSQN